MLIAGLVEPVAGHCATGRVCWQISPWAVGDVQGLAAVTGQQTRRRVEPVAPPARGHAGDWATRAACAEPGIDPELFFAREERHGSRAAAMAAEATRVCHRCPVREECAATASASGQRWGIWGGTDREEIR
jgi:WhiB family redox-sensing transcriptional regulator